MALHLVLESQLLDTIRPLCDSVRSFKVSQFVDQGTVDAVLQTLRDTQAAMDSWRQRASRESSGAAISTDNADPDPSAALLVLFSHLVEVGMYLKLSSDCVRSLPSPLVDCDPGLIVVQFGGPMVVACRGAISLVVEQQVDLCMAPGCYYTLSCLVYATMRQIQMLHPDVDDPISPYIGRFREVLATSHIAGPAILGHIDGMEPIADWSGVGEANLRSNEALWNDFNLFCQFDISGTFHDELSALGLGGSS